MMEPEGGTDKKMKINNFQVLALLVIIFIACAREPNLNLIVITIDTLRADRLSCYGYNKPTTPNIDKFATRCVLFENVICQEPQTVPSHASMFTGLHPRTHKAITNVSKLNEKFVTLAEILKQKGYATAAFVSTHILDSKYGLNQGFDKYWEIHKFYKPALRRRLQDLAIDPTTNQVMRWLKANHSKRFFLWIHWFHPHRPYIPPPQYEKAFAQPYSGKITGESDLIDKYWREGKMLDPADVNHLRGLYDGEVAFADHQVGTVLGLLDSLNLMQSTVIIVTSDHGEILYDHENYFGHDIGLYDECLKVPLLIYSPEFNDVPKRISQTVQTLDILPTIADLLSFKVPEKVQGQSLTPLMNNEAFQPVEYTFAETFPFPEKALPRHCVRTPKWKLEWRESKEGIIKVLYDLESDPEERQNLYEDSTRVAAHLDSVLANWLKDGGLHPAPIPTARESGRWKILKSLGYID